MKILLPIDSSPHSKEALDEVASRVWPDGTEIRILYVISVPIPDFPDPLLAFYAVRGDWIDKEKRRSKEAVQHAIDKLSRYLRGDNHELSTKIVEGEPKEVIIKEATEWGAELIVVGSHERTAIGKLFMGSVSETVSANAPCPVQVVHCP